MKEKKLIILFVLLISSFLLYIYICNTEYSYSYEYIVNKASVEEVYSTIDGIFTFNINDEFIFEIEGDYSTKRGLIKEISIEDNCINIEGDLNFFDFCTNEYNYYLEDNVIYSEQNITYSNLEFNKLLSNNIFVWNYNGYIFYSNGEIYYYDLFENDVYLPSLIYQIEQYLFIPDYDESYYFDAYYLVDMLTGTYEYISLDTEINFDLYYLSCENTSLNIYDKKNSKVYTLNILKGKTSIKNNVVYTDSDLEEESELLINNFYIEDNKLYYSLKEFVMFIKEVETSSIVYQTSDTIYFLDNGVLAYYQLGTNIIKAASSNEWLFNYESQIFIY